MIIKKKKHINNNNDSNSSNQEIQQIEQIQQEPQTNVPSKVEPHKEENDILDVLTEVTERQERRRGDRRRGYRRIEDRGLVSRAQEEAKVIKEQAAQDGFNKGLASADNEISALQEAISSILNIKQEAYLHYQNDIIEIALNVAEKILNKHVEVDNETIVDIAKNVIKETSEDDNKITFIINPADELILNENLENNSAFKNKRATMSVQTDENIPQGSCKVITNSGQIDATFSSQLSIIKKAFAEGI